MFEWNLGHHFLVHELIFNGLHDSSYTCICYLLIHSFLHLYNIKSCMPTLLLPIPSDSVIFFIQYIGVVHSLFLPLSIFKTKYFLALSFWKNEFTLMLMHVHEIFLSCYTVQCWGQECFAVCVKKNVFLYSVLFLQIFFQGIKLFLLSLTPFTAVYFSKLKILFQGLHWKISIFQRFCFKKFELIFYLSACIIWR